MKRIMLLLSVSVVLILSSCSSDDTNDKNNYQQLIVGKWAYYKQIYQGQHLYHDHSCETSQDYLEFKADMTGSEAIYKPNCEVDKGIEYFTYKIENNILLRANLRGGSYSDEPIILLDDNTLIYGNINGNRLEYKRIK